ncbi:hypothetical protein ACFE04_021710 [Oxalis oulophora]
MAAEGENDQAFDTRFQKFPSMQESLSGIYQTLTWLLRFFILFVVIALVFSSILVHSIRSLDGRQPNGSECTCNGLTRTVKPPSDNDKVVSKLQSLEIEALVEPIQVNESQAAKIDQVCDDEINKSTVILDEKPVE